MTKIFTLAKKLIASTLSTAGVNATTIGCNCNTTIISTYHKDHVNDPAMAGSFFHSDIPIFYINKNLFMKTLLQSCKKISLVLALIFFTASFVQAQRTASVTGLWSSTATWGGASVPISTDAVTINSGVTVTVDITANCASIDFLSTATVNSTVSINPGITLTVAGAITIPRQSNNINTMAVGAGILNAGSIAFTNGGGGQRHVLTISTGTVTVSGNVTQSGSTGSATITFTGAGVLNLGGSFLTSATGTFTASTGTVDYNAVGAQTIGNFTYNNLKLSGGNTKTFSAATPSSANLSIASGVVANLGTFTHSANTLTLGGAGQIAGSWGSTTSAATNKNNVFFAATTGIVNVAVSGCTPPAAPTVSSPVNYCLNSTASPLTATGSNLLWYTAPTGGTGSSTAPTPVTTAAGTTSYYVSQTVGCEGSRAQINVIVNALPVTSVVGQSAVNCFAGSDGSITIGATGGTSPYFYSVNNGTTWTATASAPPFVYGGLVANTQYRIRVQDSKGCLSK
jgi:Ig-like domain CHU_C associated/SprB repeat